MPERIDLLIPVRTTSRFHSRRVDPSDAFADALRKQLNTTFTEEDAVLFSDLLARLEFAETAE
jgi:predicted kinase